ncbi:MAG: TonB-dependent receptor [Flavobacteriaceae bacterium]|nr:TonB-dependent receptor [Flavobacteriaceae bacterium]
MINLNSIHWLKNIFGFFLLLFPLLAISQQLNFQGKVSNTENEPIANASIQILGTNKGAFTDEQGNFTIAQLQPNNYFVEISHLGYQTIIRSIELGDHQNNFSFILGTGKGELDEIIVTADRRYQDAQKTATSVSAIGAEEIERLQIGVLSEINSIAPNFRSYDDGSTGTFSLITSRGISTIDPNPIVGLYIDDVPYFSTYSFPLGISDIQRIEILRGPQGTLYGRNALAGVIKITTKNPTNELTGFAGFSYGNLNAGALKLGLNIPLVNDKVFLRLDAYGLTRDGYSQNLFLEKELQDRELFNANARLKYLANDQLSFGLQFNHQRRESDAYAFYLINPDPNNIRPILDIVKDDSSVDPFEFNFDVDVFTVATTQTFAFNTKYETNFFTLNSNFAYSNTKYDRADEFDYSPLDFQYATGGSNLNSYLNEIRLTSKGLSSLDWTTGVFVYLNRNTSNPALHFGTDLALTMPQLTDLLPYERIDKSEIDEDGIAVFGQVSYRITEKLGLTGGLRFDYQKTKIAVDRTFDKPIQPNANYEEDVEFDGWSPKIALGYEANDQVFLFANVSRGFRPGGINEFVLDPDKAKFGSENTLNYESGIKTELMNHRLKLNLTGFYTTYTDQQIFTLLDASTFSIGTDNIGESRIWGIEFESKYVVTPELSLALNAGYLNTEIIAFDDVIFDPQTDIPSTIDRSGKNLPVSPKYNANFNLTYIQPISKKINFEGVVDLNYQDDIFFDVPNVILQDSYALLNSKLGITTKSFDISLWGKNLFDQTYFGYGYGVGGFNAVSYALPRTYGISVDFKF